MAKKKKTKRKTRTIVTESLEKINSKVFDQYRKQITEMIKENFGVYALYRREKLYYIGLANDFKKRINQHLKDRHKGKWNYFSLYLIRKTDHIREVEALLLRIAKPEGNKVKGKLKGSKNLRPRLKRLLTEESKRKIKEILGQTKRPKTKKTVKRKGKLSKADKPLKGVFPKGKRLTATYKGKVFKAWVYKSGTVKLKSNGKLYNTPSAAGKVARGGRSTNGWSFWKYKNKKGELVKIATLRK